MVKKRTRHEDKECAQFAHYLIDNNIPFMRIASEIPTRNMGVINRMKREGFKAGYADYFIYVPYYENGAIKFPGLFIEMKHSSGNFPVQTGKDPQYDMLRSYAFQGYVAYCCRGADAAILAVEMYFKGRYSNLYDLNPQPGKNRKILAKCYNTLIGQDLVPIITRIEGAK